jgi:phage terminase large subunit
MLANALMPAEPGVDTVQAVRELPPQLVSRPTIDWQNPDYSGIFRARASRLEKIRAEPGLLPSLKAFYRDNPIDFINDWGVTVDPRAISRGLPAAMPFILFPRQVQWLEFILKNWKDGVPGITEKSRDVGVSWLAMALSCTLCLHHRDMTIGFGSSKEDKVDRLDDPDCLFYKARKFLQCLPHEFRGAWEEKRHAPHMRILFPQTGSAIVGEAGDGIGRGGRSSLYFVDEAAHLERAALVEASLAANTNSRQDMSSVNGRANPFAIKRHSGNIRVFTMHWRDDPRKDDAWYRKKCEELDPVTVAAEIDINYAASVEGVVIPSAWVQAAIGAHLKLGITPTGSKFAGLDVADEGVDKNAFAGRHGFLLEYVKSWSGKNSDIYKTVVRAFSICDEMGYSSFDYDADGLGAGVRGDANNLNDQRAAAGMSYIYDQPFRGSGAVHDPEGEMVKKRKNKDYFLNAKAQAWWALRIRFQATYRAVVEKMPYDPDDIISIDPTLDELAALAVELSQPTYSINGVGKTVIDKEVQIWRTRL